MARKSGAACDHNGVYHVIAHRSQLPYISEVGPDSFYRENSAIHGENLGAAFQCGTYGYKIRVQSEQTDCDDNDVKQYPEDECFLLIFCVKQWCLLPYYSSPFFNTETIYRLAQKRRDQKADNRYSCCLSLLAIIKCQFVQIGNQGVCPVGRVYLL